MRLIGEFYTVSRILCCCCCSLRISRQLHNKLKLTTGHISLLLQRAHIRDQLGKLRVAYYRCVIAGHSVSAGTYYVGQVFITQGGDALNNGWPRTSMPAWV